jgi:ADP-ribosylglycohydrolase
MDGWLVKNRELFHRRAPGNTCLAALKDGEPFYLSDSRQHNTSKGCGAVMRTAPVGLFAQSPYVCKIWDSKMRDEQSYAIGRDVGYLTHGHPSGYLSAAFLAKLIGRIIDGDDLDSALYKTWETLVEHHYANETMAAINKAQELARNKLVQPCPETITKIGEGWVGEEALAIAIYCALVAGDDFDFGVRLAVNHAGDSDSTGAIAGNILGALLGRKAISNEWLEQLELRNVIEQVATDLFLGFQDGDEWWNRYPGH